MTKSQRNLILLVSLFFAIFTLCSIFAIAGVQTPQTVEAATQTELDARKPGLYKTGTTELVKNKDGKELDWDYMKMFGDFFLEEHGTEGITWKIAESKREELVGDLVCKEYFGDKNFSDAFKDCSGLTYVDLSRMMNSESYSLRDATLTGMFEGCTNLVGVNFGNEATSADKNVLGDCSRMFKGCTSLESVNLGALKSYDTLKTMSEMFADCSNLKSVSFGSVYEEDEKFCRNAENMSKMFYNCSSLTSLDLSKFGIAMSANMDSIFAGCSKLQSIDLSGWILHDTSGESMFAGCSKLKEITLPQNVSPTCTGMELPEGTWGTMNELGDFLGDEEGKTLEYFAGDGITIVKETSTEDVASTGVKFNILAIVVCIACLSTLIVMTSKKKEHK